MKYLFFDTETSGLPDFGKPLDDDSQPHIVQLAALLTDDQGKVISSLNVLCKPAGWTIPEHVTAIHGITVESATAYGVPERSAVGLFKQMADAADVVIGHNIAFDIGLIRIAFARFFSGWVFDKQTRCTMFLGTSVCQLPPTEKMVAKGMTGHKKPSIAELYKHMFGEDMDNAHDAMADTVACKESFFELLKMGVLNNDK